MLPDFVDGVLPPGIHPASWDEAAARFGSNERRKRLLTGLRLVLVSLTTAGCERVWLDGSFVTAEPLPGDFDLLWDLEGVDIERLDPVLLEVEPPRLAQKAKYGGDILPNVMESGSGMPFLDFFSRTPSPDASAASSR